MNSSATALMAMAMAATPTPASAPVSGECGYCSNPLPYKCKTCKEETQDVDAPEGIFEPHAGRTSIVGNVGPDFWFV